MASPPCPPGEAAALEAPALDRCHHFQLQPVLKVLYELYREESAEEIARQRWREDVEALALASKATLVAVIGACGMDLPMRVTSKLGLALRVKLQAEAEGDDLAGTTELVVPRDSQDPALSQAPISWWEPGSYLSRAAKTVARLDFSRLQLAASFKDSTRLLAGQLVARAPRLFPSLTSLTLDPTHVGLLFSRGGPLPSVTHLRLCRVPSHKNRHHSLSAAIAALFPNLSVLQSSFHLLPGSLLLLKGLPLTEVPATATPLHSPPDISCPGLEHFGSSLTRLCLDAVVDRPPVGMRGDEAGTGAAWEPRLSLPPLPELRDLRVTYSQNCYLSGASALQMTLTAPCLTSLSLSSGDAIHGDCLLSMLRLPGLRRLSLSNLTCAGHDRAFQPAVDALRPMPCLERLHLSSVTLDGPAWQAVRVAALGAPGLVEARLSYVGTDDTVPDPTGLEALRPSASSLRSLTLTGWSRGSMESWGTNVARFTRLTSLTLATAPCMPNECWTLRALRNLRELDLTLASPKGAAEPASPSTSSPPAPVGALSQAGLSMTFVDLGRLARLRQLRLRVSGVPVTTGLLLQLTPLQRLQTLRVHARSWELDENVLALVRDPGSLPQLRRVDLRRPNKPSKVAYWASLLNAALLSRHLSEPIERRELDWRDLHRQFGGEGDTDSEDMRSGASAVVDGEASADDGSGDGEDETDSDWEGSESDEGSTTDDDDDVDVDDDEEVEEEDEEEEPLEDEVDEAEPEGGDGEGVEGGHGDGVEGGDGEGGSGEGDGMDSPTSAGGGEGAEVGRGPEVGAAGSPSHPVVGMGRASRSWYVGVWSAFLGLPNLEFS